MLGILEIGKRKKSSERTAEMTAALAPEDPVNYNSVLDYLVGLSKEDYDKMLKISNVYREANRKAATILEVDDEPTTALKHDAPTDEQVDEALDAALNDPIGFLESELPDSQKPKKAQAADKKVTIPVQE